MRSHDTFRVISQHHFDAVPLFGAVRIKSLDLYKPIPIFLAGNDKEDGMEIDVARVLGLVTRSVRNFDKDGKAASAVTLSRLYDTSVDDHGVYAA
jgi:hypothetical protein